MAEITRSLSPTQQAHFAQEKLRQIYTETCLWLAPHKDFLHLLQDIILWRKVAVSAVIVCLVELFFWHLYTSDKTYITVISEIGFWWLLADAFWVVATRDRRLSNKKKAEEDNRENRISGWLRRRQKELRYMCLEDAITSDAKELRMGESAPFEVICLWIAKVIMLVDNIQLALRHWSQEQPYLFAVVTGTFGLTCIVIGYFFSGVFLMFLITNYLMLAPVIRYYSLVERVNGFVNTHYPALAEKVNNYYQYAKGLLTPLAEKEFNVIHLDPREPINDDLPPESRTRQSNIDTLHDDHGDTLVNGDDDIDNSSGATPNPTKHLQDPAMSLTPFSQDPMESLAPFITPSEGFPSITAFFNEDSISLPSFQQQQNKTGRKGVVGASGRRKQMHPQDSLSLDPFESMDPLRDSFDEELPLIPETETQPLEPSVPPYEPTISPSEPPPPYESSPYFRQNVSPLVSGFKAKPQHSSTPETTTGAKNTDKNVRKRAKN